jgi:hypothetical protein
MAAAEFYEPIGGITMLHQLIRWRHCDTVGRDPGEIRKTVGFFVDPFEDLDSYLKTTERYAELGIEMVNAGPFPGNPDPVGFIRRLGDELVPRLAEIA